MLNGESLRMRVVCIYVDSRVFIHLRATIQLNRSNPIVCEGPRRWDEKRHIRLVGNSCPKLQSYVALVAFTSLFPQGVYERGLVTNSKGH